MSQEEVLMQRHRKELKDFQSTAAAMKKSAPVSDKKRRKEVLADIERLEKELQGRQDEELQSIRQTEVLEPSVEDSASSTVELASRGNTGALAVKIAGLEIGNNNLGVETNDKNDDDDNDDEEPEGSPSGTPKKLTRAQRRRQNKQAKLQSLRLTEVKADESKPLQLSARTTEKIKLKKILDENGLRLVDMPSDGNCLYSSISYQLRLNGLIHSVLSLRTSTAGFMTSHMDEFIPFLVHPESGDPLTHQDFIQYCEDIAKTNAWGSQIELRALSAVFRWPIRVLQAEGPEVWIGEEYASDEKIPLTVVYHRHELSLGEHYSSVAPK